MVSFALVLIPTTCMGATLPLLVADATRRSGNTGRSVGVLYFANTIGAAAACFAASWLLLGALGMRGSTQVAAGLNLVLGAAVFLLARRAKAAS